jgi:excisionase family DNA binding protein
MSNYDRVKKGMLSVAEGASLLGVKEATLRSWILYRRIEFVKIGGRVLIRSKTLEDLIARGTIPASRGRELA